MTAVMLVGALAGVGVISLVLLFERPQADGAVGLAQLDAERRRSQRDATLTATTAHPQESLRQRRFGTALREAMEARGYRLPAPVRADLSMAGRTVEGHLAASVLAGVAGFIAPLVLSLFISVLYGGAPGPTSLVVSVIVGLVAALLPTLQVRAQAAELRRDFRHVVGSFLDLVAMNLAGGRGVPEALSAAAAVSDSAAFVRIRDTLETARLQGITPWAALGQLGDDVAIDELRDLAAALALVAEDGAKVRDSLTARATSMRRRELADAEGRAAQRSQSMLVAQLLLCVGFLLFLIYPAVARILGM